MPAALSFLMENVTGPAGTEFLSGVHASAPDWLARLMFTVLIPPSPAAAPVGADAAITAGVRSHRRGDVVVIPLSFPFVLGGRCGRAPSRRTPWRWRRARGPRAARPARACAR